MLIVYGAEEESAGVEGEKQKEFIELLLSSPHSSPTSRVKTERPLSRDPYHHYKNGFLFLGLNKKLLDINFIFYVRWCSMFIAIFNIFPQ